MDSFQYFIGSWIPWWAWFVYNSILFSNYKPICIANILEFSPWKRHRNSTAWPQINMAAANPKIKYSSLEYTLIILPDNWKESIRDKYILWLNLQLWLRCTYYCLRLTSESQRPQRDNTHKLYQSQKYDTVGYNRFWGLHVQIGQRYMDSYPEITPPKVLGKGNGEAPEIWSIFGTSLLNCLIEAGHGEDFKFWL